LIVGVHKEGAIQMARLILLVAAAILVSFTGIAGAQMSEAQKQWFPDADMMRIGCYYYPEAWPPEQWARDVANMKKLNLEFVHMGEFAWAFMEPTEGHYDFSWLDKVVQLCADQGLKVVLCTPSATPPVWLTQAHPEVLMIDADGHVMQHGTREQASWSVDIYRQYVGKIDEALAQHYGNNPAVWGWQIDNEPSHYGKLMDYNPACVAKFQAWLKNKYGSIDHLNRDWGTSFWSQKYQDFSQIRIPNENEQVAQMNPHALLDAQRWYVEELADFLRFQANSLRKYCGDRQWVTTNFMHDYPAQSAILSKDDLDLMSFTIYPVHGTLNEGPLGFRLGSASAMSWAHDFFRNINGAEGIMELQPGQVNWGEVNPQPYPGAVHMWLMRAFAAGAKFVCTYRYREPRYGAELYHYGLAGPDGVTPTFGGQQYSQAASEIAMLRTLRDPNAQEPAAYAARRTAILFNLENRWDIDNHKQTVRWDTMGHILKQYRALKRLGCPVDAITEDKDFSTYPFLIVPAYQLVDEKLVQRWTDYAQNGGHLIITCRTAQKDRRGFLWEGPWEAPILDLIGAKVAFYDCLPAPINGNVSADGQTFSWASWGEILDPNQGTDVVAQYTDQYYAGRPAAVTRKLGQGTVTYIGVDSLDGNLEATLIRDVFQRAGVAVENYADGFLVDWRDGFWVATNFTDKVQTIDAPVDAKVLIGQRDVPIAGVTVWQ
jgi:beta-galactosidase